LIFYPFSFYPFYLQVSGLSPCIFPCPFSPGLSLYFVFFRPLFSFCNRQFFSPTSGSRVLVTFPVSSLCLNFGWPSPISFAFYVFPSPFFFHPPFLPPRPFLSFASPTSVVNIFLACYLFFVCFCFLTFPPIFFFLPPHFISVLPTVGLRLRPPPSPYNLPPGPPLGALILSDPRELFCWHCPKQPFPPPIDLNFRSLKPPFFPLFTFALLCTFSCLRPF